MLRRCLRSVSICLSVLVLLVGLTTGCSARTGGTLLLVTPEADFGTVPNDRQVIRTFEIRNDGVEPLEITDLTTSCSCTLVEVASSRVGPGESTEMTVIFDPASHDGATGRFMRQVFVRSSDPDTPEQVFNFWVEVVEP